MKEKRNRTGLRSLLAVLLLIALLTAAVGCGKKGDNGSATDNGTTTNGNSGAERRLYSASVYINDVAEGRKWNN